LTLETLRKLVLRDEISPQDLLALHENIESSAVVLRERLDKESLIDRD
jgi:hypothetical protein